MQASALLSPARPSVNQYNEDSAIRPPGEWRQIIHPARAKTPHFTFPVSTGYTFIPISSIRVVRSQGKLISFVSKIVSKPSVGISVFNASFLKNVEQISSFKLI